MPPVRPPAMPPHPARPRSRWAFLGPVLMTIAAVMSSLPVFVIVPEGPDDYVRTAFATNGGYAALVALGPMLVFQLILGVRHRLTSARVGAVVTLALGIAVTARLVALVGT